jgi:hypothetical protein
VLRIATYQLNPNAPSTTTPAVAIQAFNELVAALNKVKGVSNAAWYFGNGGIVVVGEGENYATSDAILADRGVQAAGGKVLALGYAIAEDLFLTDLKQVGAFIQP